MVRKATRVGIEVTGESTQAVNALRRVREEGVGTGKQMREAAQSLRLFGSVAAAFGGTFLTQATRSTIAFSKAIERTSALLGLNQQEANGFADEAKNLLNYFIDLGGDGDEFGAILLENAVRIKMLGGEGAVTTRVLEVLRRAFELGTTTTGNATSSIEDLISLMKAYKLPAEAARDVTNDLYRAYAATGRPIGTMAKELVDLADEAAAANVPFIEVLNTLAATPEGSAGLIRAALKLKDAFDEGDQKARGLLQRIGALENTPEGGKVPLEDVLFNLASAFSTGILTADDLKRAIDETVSDEDVGRARTLVDTWNEAVRVKRELDALSGRAASGSTAGPGEAGSSPIDASLHNARDSMNWFEAQKDIFNREIVDEVKAGESPNVRDFLVKSNMESLHRYWNGFKKNLFEFGLADGGIVTRPDIRLVGEGGEPEVDQPLSKLRAFMGEVAGGGGGGGLTINGSVSVVLPRANGRTFYRDLQRSLEWESMYGTLGGRKGR
jgi:hypothetical protein